MNAPGISLVYQDLRKRRSEPRWQFKRADFLRLAEEVGHNLAFERSCPQAHAWIGSLEFLVVPRLKLAFCYQAKAACTDFKDLINELNGLHLGTGFGNLNYGESGYSRFRLNPQDVKKENGWKFATFTRDPLERYLAVYGSTCMPKSLPNSSGQFYEHRQECCGEEVPMGKIDWEQVMSSFEQRALSDARSGLPVEEQHWSPQVELLHNCGWGKFRPENLDYRGDVSSGNVSEQVKEMLRMVRATADDMRVAEKFFPSNRIAGHKSPIKPDYRSFYRRREVVDAVKGLYAADYHLIPGIGRGFTDKVEARL